MVGLFFQVSCMNYSLFFNIYISVPHVFQNIYIIKNLKMDHIEKFSENNGWIYYCYGYYFGFPVLIPWGTLNVKLLRYMH
jgi:hypothetical protein